MRFYTDDSYISGIFSMFPISWKLQSFSYIDTQLVPFIMTALNVCIVALSMYAQVPVDTLFQLVTVMNYNILCWLPCKTKDEEKEEMKMPLMYLLELDMLPVLPSGHSWYFPVVQKYFSQWTTIINCWQDTFLLWNVDPWRFYIWKTQAKKSNLKISDIITM